MYNEYEDTVNEKESADRAKRKLHAKKCDEKNTEEKISFDNFSPIRWLRRYLGSQIITHFTIFSSSVNNFSDDMTASSILWLSKHVKQLPKYLISDWWDVTSICKYIQNKNYRYFRAFRFRPDTQIIIKLDTATYFYLAVDSTKDDSGEVIKMYFIGKHSAKYYREYKKCMKLLTEDRAGIYIVEKYGDREELCRTSIVPSKDKLKGAYYIPPIVQKDIMGYLETSMAFAEKMWKECDNISNPGLLLYGPPGTGKTSLIRYIASYYNIDLLTITNITERLESIVRNFSDSSSDGEWVMVVFEDVDRLLTGQLKDAKIHTLLQLFDGFSSLPKVIFVMTTNHLEQLDPALIRDGRFDKRVELPYFTKEDAKHLCEIYHCSTELVTDLEYPIAPSEVKAHIIDKMRKNAIRGKEE